MRVGERITNSDDDQELDHLSQNVKLMEPDSDDDDGGNEDYNVHGSQVPLFATVRSPTDLPRSETGLAPGEVSDVERRNEEGPCQRPAPDPNNIIAYVSTDWIA